MSSRVFETRVVERVEQFVSNGAHYVGRRVQMKEPNGWFDIELEVFFDGTWHDCILFRLDYDRGDVFVDPAILTPFPSEPIPEPSM